MFRQKIILLFLLMLLISFVGVIIVKVSVEDEIFDDKNITIVTSFYPMYILTLNIADGIEGVEVVNLIENQAGCTHDYTLTTKDMKVISKADIFIMNGGGMEDFALKAIDGFSELKVIDASEGIHMLEGTKHSHDDDDIEEQNAHVWMSIELYMMQLDTITEKLAGIDPANKDKYVTNKDNYKNMLMKLKDDQDALSKKTDGIKVILFHEAFSYLANDLGMEAMHILPLDEDTALSAKTTSDIINIVNKYDIKFLFVQEEYSDLIKKTIAAETNADVYIINPLTEGELLLNAYIKGCSENINAISKALERTY